MSINPTNIITGSATFIDQPSATPSAHGQLDIQNIAGVLKQVDDAGTATSLGGGGGGLPDGTGLVKVVDGVGDLAVAGTDYDVALPSGYIAAVNNATVITIPTFNGETAGGIEISGTVYINTTSGGDYHLTILPNGLISNTYVSNGSLAYSNLGFVVRKIPVGTLEQISFKFVMPITKTGRGPRAGFVNAMSNPTNILQLGWGTYNSDTTVITSWTVALTSTAGGQPTPTGFASPIPTYTSGSGITWRALGGP